MGLGVIGDYMYGYLKSHDPSSMALGKDRMTFVQEGFWVLGLGMPCGVEGKTLLSLPSA